MHFADHNAWCGGIANSSVMLQSVIITVIGSTSRYARLKNAVDFSHSELVQQSPLIYSSKSPFVHRLTYVCLGGIHCKSMSHICSLMASVFDIFLQLHTTVEAIQ